MTNTAKIESNTDQQKAKNMTTYTINPNELEAVALAASTEQTRYYLNGVFIERYADGTIALIATDGHRMASVRAKLTKQPAESFILGSADIKKALQLVKSAKKEFSRVVHNFIKVVIDVDGLDLLISVVLMDKELSETINTVGTFNTKAIDGTFPDYRRIVPSKDGEGAYHISFNCAYMNAFGSMVKLLTGNKCEQVSIQNTGISNPMIITIPGCADFVGILMPMRA